MKKVSCHPAAAKGGANAARADYAAMAQRMVLHGVVTRQLLAEELTLSPGSITKHVRWLVEQGLVKSRRLPVAHAKKPIDELWLDAQAATIALIWISKGRLAGEICGLDLQPIHRFEQVWHGSGQSQILSALDQAAAEILSVSQSLKRPIDSLGAGVAGLVDPVGGIIYQIQGIPGWEACQPWEISPRLHKLPQLKVWTRVACKVRGFCQQTKRDHEVAYLECSDRSVSLASISEGRLKFGLHGTSSPLLHTTVKPGGPLCFCGREGCFHHYLRSNTLSPELMFKGLQRFFASMPEDEVAVEWQSPSTLPQRALPRNEATAIHVVTDGEELARLGLRALAAEEALDRKVQSVLTH